MDKKWLGSGKITVKKLCILAMLIAITVFLAIFCTFRIGNAIKIPMKFVSVFVTAVMFGPLWGGAVGAIGDILNSFLVPVGAPLPQITVIEFVCGFVFGLFFYKKGDKNYFLRAVVCAFVLSVIDITAVSYVLKWAGYFPSFYVAVSVRFLASIIKFFMYVLVMMLIKPYLGSFERLMRG